jgi:large subunit ribosomal protein L13
MEKGKILMKTFHLKAGEIQKSWHIIDLEDVVVGRAATIVAKLLRGKHKPEWTPHMDCGDHVIVINAEKAHFTGNKRKDKVYYWHTGHPGGIKQRTAEQVLDGRFSDRVFRKAVERMMGSKGPLKRDRLRHLYVYAGSQHPHAAQKPVFFDVKALSSKNSKHS